LSGLSALNWGNESRPANESLRSGSEEVGAGDTANPALADAGVIFGTGFAPYTGGPMNYLQSGEH